MNKGRLQKKNGKFNDIEIKGGRGSGPKHYFKKHLNDDISKKGVGVSGKCHNYKYASEPAFTLKFHQFVLKFEQNSQVFYDLNPNLTYS